MFGIAKLNSIARAVEAVISDSSTLVVTHQDATFLAIYNRSGDTFTEISDPATLPPSFSSRQGASWNPAGTSLAVAHLTTPYITIYNRSGDTFTKVANPTTLPDGNANGIAWNEY